MTTVEDTAVLSWDDVLAETGPAAKAAGPTLDMFKDQIVMLSLFEEDKKVVGKGEKEHEVTKLTAHAVNDENGEFARVPVPDKYADRIREILSKRPGMNLVIRAKVEVGQRGAMLRPLTAPQPKAESTNGTGEKKRGRPRKNGAVTVTHEAQG